MVFLVLFNAAPSLLNEYKFVMYVVTRSDCYCFVFGLSLHVILSPFLAAGLNLGS